MSTVRDDLRGLVRAARGAVEWHVETGDAALPVEAGYAIPPLGTVAPSTIATKRSRHGDPPGNKATESSLEPMEVASPAAPAVTPAGEAPESTPPAAVRVPTVMPAGDAAARAGRLQVLRDEVGDCKRCGLCNQREEVVFGFGRPDARLLFVGEAPTDEADATGTPFVDPGGRLLTRMVHAMGLRRAEVYLAYVVMCRPPGRSPEPDEIETCSAFLRRQVDIVQPEVLVALGSLPARLLTGRDAALARLQGEWGEFEGIPVMPTFPLEAMLQNPRLKGAVWGDLKRVMRRLGLQEKRR